MKKAKIAELKNHLSRYLDHVRSGESVLVLDRDQPIAQIVPLARPTEDSRGHDGRRARAPRRGGVVRFWDSSALIPLVVAERGTALAERLLRDDPAVVVWTLTRVELLSALARRRRAGPAAARRRPG